MSEPPDSPPVRRAQFRRSLAAARDWLDKEGRVALATVVGTWGSAPVRVGGQMVMAPDGRFEGSVSGGCVEGEVIAEAEADPGRRQAQDAEVRRRRRDGLAGRPAVRRADQGLRRAAGGAGGLPLFERGPSTPLAPRSGLVVRTRLDDGRREVFERGEAHAEADVRGSASRAARASCRKRPKGEVFLHALVPPARVLIIGATHIGQMLAQLVKIAGYEVVVIDPRTAFAAEARFPGIRLDTEWPQDTIPKIGLDPYTAVVALAHVGHIDDEALKLALRSDCFYIGALGSRRNHAKRTERLTAAGFSAEEIERIHCPIGINIGAQNPQEIAISIMAEIVLALRGPKEYRPA